MSCTGDTVTINLKQSSGIYSQFQQFYPKKSISEEYQFSNAISNTENLSNICIRLLDDVSSTCYFFAYRPLSIELVARLISNPSIEQQYLQLVGSSQQAVPGSRVLSTVSRILTYASEVSNLVECFLEKKDFFNMDYEIIDQSELQVILLAFYRLVSTDRKKFIRFVDPVRLHNIITSEESTNINQYLAILIESLYLSMAEDVRVQMIERYVDQTELIGYCDGDRQFNYSFLSVFEGQRLSNLTKLSYLHETSLLTPDCISFTNDDMSSGVRIIGGVLVPHLRELGGERQIKPNSEFIPIPKSIDSLRELATYVRSSEPVILVGKTGSGKTFLVNEISRMLGVETNDLIKIHLNQQTDPKLLLGTYTSGSKPGTFEWKNGVLTSAVREGKWVLVEDIDKAPNEVLSILLSLLENRELTIPSRGNVIRAANGFQFIATIRSPSDSNEIIVPDIIGLRLWKTLKLEELDTNELTLILKRRFPLLHNFISLFITAFFAIKKTYESRRMVTMNDGVSPRPISIRDLMKFCKRSNKLLVNAGIRNSSDMIPDELYDLIFQESVDCFASALSSSEAIKLLTGEIGAALEIPTSRIDLQLHKHVPVFEEYEDSITLGRAHIQKHRVVRTHRQHANGGNGAYSSSFARTNHSLRLMEKVGVGISMCEPLVLVGETGTGKTTVVQEMAKMLNKKLTVINVSQQTEVGDLLGGFKPVSTKLIALPIQEQFEDLFNRSFSAKRNASFLKLLAKCFNKSQWKNVVRLWKEAYKMAQATFGRTEDDSSDESSVKKKRRLNDSDKSILLDQWAEIYQSVCEFEKQFNSIENSFVFQFIEGSLVKAVKNGNWLLLDEINLASSETLDSISDLLSDDKFERSILLSEKGDVESIRAHPDFRIFACMNPATDVGKRDLPPGIRSKFTEIYVHSPDEDIADLLMIIDKYIGKYALSDEWIGNDIAELYLQAKRLADLHEIVDGANQKPRFSIRTLTRTLLYVQDIVGIYGLRRSLYEGFCMSFLTLLDEKSEEALHPLIKKFTVGRLKNVKSILSQVPPNPDVSGKSYAQFKHYWIKKGPEIPVPQKSYIITPFVEKNLLNLVRATSGRRFPVLLQGPTSAGKTSMINYLAKITGHKFVRINNHEHTDLQEYLGTYVSDETGKLSFKEGVLVEALRNGYWIVLDELNLAPTDVLEALNRLLDDNRELFIPETQEVVRPHPEFMLFATQNPPGLYGGRKILSKAFRNRFLELHFDDIPQNELEIILRERCQIAPRYAERIVEVYRELSVQRQATRLFEQKNSFATLRDLFRWAGRDAVGYEQLAANGYMLLAERVRRPEEKLIVKRVLERVMKVKLDMATYYASLEDEQLLHIKGPVIWTKAMRRLSVLVTSALQQREPILLVGETGCGKTTICQLLSHYFKKNLIIVNAHQNSETSDLLGAQRPVRNRSELQTSLIGKIREVLKAVCVDTSHISSLGSALRLWNDNKKLDGILQEDKEVIKHLMLENEALFEWSDGPLVEAMKNGYHFLLDEISLADDSVLERLNSVLEPERSLLLAEKGPDDALIVAKEGFQFLATMNPGGDYGKKELSPALRNRFTEIWVPSMEDFDDVRQIVSAKLDEGVKQFTDCIVSFSHWYGLQLGGGRTDNGVISLRDILAWIQFINSCHNIEINDDVSLLHGACMVFIDALGTHSTSYLAENEAQLNELKLSFVRKLSELSGKDLSQIYKLEVSISSNSEFLLCGHFRIRKRDQDSVVTSFSLQAPTTASNSMRVARALQVRKPILLEGSPGVGKTSLITALAQATGNRLTRINLSEQTDLIDLFGSDSPVEGGRVGEFVWRDGPFLRAMQRGEWVLLDEMNLASQSILEGLNACLDHRGEAYIPELDKSFTSHPDFRVFAAQNPQSQGGGRKGLPKSFINRFTVVYVDTLKEPDLRLIAAHIYPNIDVDIRDKMISFMSVLESQVVTKRSWGSSGQPWEFNLRDTLRWLSLLDSESITNSSAASDFFQLVIRQRFRSVQDRRNVDDLFESIFGPIIPADPFFDLKSSYIQVQHAVIPRKPLTQFDPDNRILGLQGNVPLLESLMHCIKMSYPCLLVGPSGAGKSELIKYCASIIGSRVFEFPMNSDVDSMDILGGFEQSDAGRTLAEISDDVSVELLSTASLQMTLEPPNEATIQLLLRLLIFISSDGISVPSIPSVISQLLELSTATTNDRLAIFAGRLQNIETDARSSSTVNFQWFDGLLVQAVEKGYWLILDNANLCSPSVLDRLNSLLELDGKLVINECADDEGATRTIIPHPNFRLFLTSDPKYGELSRAMRNRAVEIYVGPLAERATSFDSLCVGLHSEHSEAANISQGLNNLSLQEATYRPITAFISSRDSRTRDYALLLDSYQAASSRGEQALSSLLSFVGLHRFDGLPSLLEACEQSSEFKTDSFFEAAVDEIMLLREHNVPDLFLEIYQEAVEKSLLLQENGCDIAPYQALCLPLNSFVLPLISSSFKFAESSEGHYFLQDWSMVSDFSKRLQQVRLRAENGKVTDLSPLEKSAALSLGRDVKNSPRLPVYDLVVNVYRFICQCLERGTTAEVIFESPTYFKFLFELGLLLQQLVICSENYNESYLRFLQRALADWLQRPSLLYDVSAVATLSAEVKIFATQMKLSRGLSMSLLWSSSRADYPTTEEAWLHYETLSDIARRFDAVSRRQFPDTYKVIVDLKLYFVEMLDSCIHDVLSPDLLQFEEQAEAQVSQLMKITDGFLIQRSSHFGNLFDNILAFVELGTVSLGNSIELSDDILRLSLLSDRPTALLPKYRLAEQFKPYPRIFDSIWGASNAQMKVSLFDDEFFRELLRSLDLVKGSPGGGIDDTLSDINFLIVQLITRSQYIFEDHLEQIQGLATKWIRHICEIHNRSLSPELEKSAHRLLQSEDGQSLSEYTSLMSRNGLEAFANVFGAYFAPCLVQKSTDIESIGSCWIMLSFGLILLYVPDLAFDPATSEHAAYEGYLKLQAAIDSIHRSFVTFRQARFGDSKIHAEGILPDISEEQRSRKPQVFRPTDSVSELSNEWCSFLNAYLDRKYLDTLINAANDLSSSSTSKVENFEVNASQFILRLKSGYPLYADLNDILVGYIYGLKLGFELLQKGARQRSLKFGSPLLLSNPVVVSSSSVVNSTFIDAKALCRQCPISDSNADRIYCTYLELASFHKDPREQSDRNSFFNQSLLGLYYRWSLRNLKQEESDSIEQGVYKFSDPSMDAEADFQSLFPEAEDLIHVSASEGSKVIADSEDLYHRVCLTYVNTFCGSSEEKTGYQDMILLTADCFHSFEALSEQMRYGANDPATLVSFLFLCDSVSKSFSEDIEDSKVDFYKGYSASETRKANTAVKNLQGGVHRLLDQWPEHAILLDLFRICGEFLSYPISTPVFSLLSKVEQIHTYLNQWEEYAHSGVSLRQHVEILSSLVVRWRKLELSSWNQVLTHEEERVTKSTGKWWFHLFETILLPAIKGELEETDQIKIVGAINIFMAQASYGDFDYRLKLLEAFALHMRLLESSASMSDALLNIVTFYKQFNEVRAGHVKDIRTKLEKDVKEVILLASWKDVNVDALKQSSQRSHRSLYKIVRKYRDTLSLPMKPLIEVGLSLSENLHVHSALAELQSVSITEDTAVVELCSEVGSWSERNARLRDISMVSENMRTYIENLYSESTPSLHDFASGIIEEAARLRKNTPGELTEENKVLCNSLKSEKRMLLSGTLRELKRMGLKLHLTTDITQILASVTGVLAISKHLPEHQYDSVDIYFFRMLELLPRLRAAVRDVNPEFPATAAHKCLAAAETLLSTLVTGRDSMVEVSELSGFLDRFLLDAEEVSYTTHQYPVSSSVISACEDASESALRTLNWLPKVLEFALDSIKIASNHTSRVFDVKIFTHAAVLVKQFSLSSHLLYSVEQLETLKSIQSFLKSLCADLSKWKESNSDVSFIADFVIEWIQERPVFALPEVSLSDQKSIEDVERSLRSLCLSVMLSVQHVSKIHSEQPAITSEDDKWLQLAQRRLTKYVKLLHSKKISSKLKECISVLRSVEYTDRTAAIASALIEQALPLVKHYRNLVSVVEAKLAANYVDLSSSVYELSTLLYNLAKDGFCSPEPASKKQPDSNKMEDGTGMGDGEGATNVSKDVEDDDDLSDQAQQENPEENKDNDPDDDDDAVSIEGDMAGNTEDVSENEDEEHKSEDEKENEDEDEELDEEVDDVDDMDPNAIDEKMWDEQASEDSKEKESDKMPENSKPDNDTLQEMEENMESKKEEEGDSKDEKSDAENDSDAEDEEDVGEQDDAVQQNEMQDKFDDQASEGDALELPEDIDLDSSDEQDEEEGEEEGEEDKRKDDEDEMSDSGEDMNTSPDEKSKEIQEEDGQEEAGDESEGDVDDESDEAEEEEQLQNGDGEIGQEEGEESDEELMDVEKKEVSKEEDEKEDKNASRIEGLEGDEGGESADDNIDKDSAAQQQSGVQSEGAEAGVEQEEENVGGGGGTSSMSDQKEEKANEDDEKHSDSSRDEISKSLKQLGDSMKEFHRRREEIKEVTDDEMVEQRAGEKPDEFQHLDNENAENETQALGSANKDQLQSINEDMAIDDEDEERQEQEGENNEDNEESPLEHGIAAEDNLAADNTGADAESREDNNVLGGERAAIVGERKEEQESEEGSMSDPSYDSMTEDRSIESPEHKRPYAEAQQLWLHADEATRDLTAGLSEQLRLILEPTLATKLRGDYKTGKRLNMKRIIPYIASQFRKDKIWMRRTKPSKREYQIMIAVDDSKSMSESNAVNIAFQSISMVSKALTQLESGQLAVAKFGTDAQIVHPFEKPFNTESGIQVFRKFLFDDTKTDVKNLVVKSLSVFSEARASGDSELWQLQIILSDGVCEDHSTLQRLVRKAREEKIMIVFVIIDCINDQESILDMNQVTYVPTVGGPPQLHVTKYLDSFPFEYYVVVHNIKELPDMLALILRQYFSEISSS
ncbi:DEKNAAC105062 [Brettanomyces naardenensis]|uniref:Midasin n=1 Tax=Brettanomyces naardenensis TaxID=13370 RepID=A0A448YSD4_BRENA|nr:DEKNAAC105062 [Brettanomyces naardenensis]